ncbi:MAG: hypothetical protein OXD54_13500 [Candidatus Poribacteria bacterium]|nr:hypothetical protein [Candidatus Poribacteria bacterium]
MMSIHAAMAKENVIFEGIVEADKTYIVGKKRKDYDREDIKLYQISTKVTMRQERQEKSTKL